MGINFQKSSMKGSGNEINVPDFYLWLDILLLCKQREEAPHNNLEVAERMKLSIVLNPSVLIL